MAKLKHDAEGYRIICIILSVVILFLIYGWHRSEENRLKLLDEVIELRQVNEELEYDLRKMSEEFPR